MEENDKDLVALLGKRDEATFEKVFKEHFKGLHAYAFTILKDEAAAEEIVQNVFLKLWERMETITIMGSVAAYLYKATYNESLNLLKHQKVKTAYQHHISYQMKNQSDSALKKLSVKELEERLLAALNDLPEQCRTIFQMSRFEELRYREIADKLDLSVKTVENQMGKALKILRMKLVDLLPISVLLLLTL